MLTDLDLNGFTAINLGAPTNPNDAVRLVDLEALVVSGGTGTVTVDGSGLIKYTFNASDITNSLLHKSGLTIGSVYQTAVYDTNRQPGSGAPFEVIDNTPGTINTWAYDDTNKRLLISGAHHTFRLLVGSSLDMAQLGVLANNTSATYSQEGLFTTVRDFTMGRFSSDIQAVMGPKITANGIMWRATTDPVIDMKMAPWIAGSSFKFIARGGFTTPHPIVKFGRGTSPQNRFSIPTDVDVHVEGDQDSNLANTTTRVVGVEVYDDVGASSPFRSRAARCYVGTRVKGNTEKKRIFSDNAYCSIAVDFVQQRVSMSDYRSKAGGAAVSDIEEYIMMEDGSGSGYQGEWNALLNQQLLASGVGVKGAYYKIATGGSASSTPPATILDGRQTWTSGRWLLFDGLKWYQVNDTDDTPDTDEINITGQNCEILFRTSYNADCSAIVNLLHESRVYKGGTVQAYKGSLTESLIIPTPAILDQGGKLFHYKGRARAGDSMIFGYTGKDKGTDCTIFDISDNHVYGCMWWFDDAAKIMGQQQWEDCDNGRTPTLTNQPMPVVRINKVADAGGFKLVITKAKNDWGLVIGDSTRKKYSTDLNLPDLSINMGNPATIISSDPSPNTYYAMWVDMVNGMFANFNQLRGKLWFGAKARKVHVIVPSSYVRSRDTVIADTGSTVTIEVNGNLTATEAFSIAWPSTVKIVATIDGITMTRVNGKWCV